MTHKSKPYHSPGHTRDHPAHNLPMPSGGAMDGQEMPGMPLAPQGFMGQPQGGM